VVIVAFAGLVGRLAMPSLAGLLILIGSRTIKPAETFALTVLIPLQYAMLVGVGLSVILHVPARRRDRRALNGSSSSTGDRFTPPG
jgi:SulP family sulfate permease